MTDHNASHDPATSGAVLLAEVIYAVEQLAQEPSSYPAIYDLALTCDRSGFFESALVLYDRCLRIADTDEDRQIAYANLTSAFRAAAIGETDVVRRTRHLRDGLYAATAALDPEGGRQPGPMCVALANRSVLFAELGHHESALTDARRARDMAIELGMRREQLIAAVGEVIARWNSTLDVTVLSLIASTKELGADVDTGDCLRSLLAIEVDVLWSLGRHDEARAAMQSNIDHLHELLQTQTAERWDNVRAGVDRLRHASAGEADELTGLPNRQFLGRWLPDALLDDAPVCIGALNLDRFGFINESFGHEAGDSVLQEVAAVLERVCRRGDSVVRTVGDEFVMVLRDTSPGDARVVFERVRQ
ncbi:MAG TPA: GGDEF domain-containing protein, partial [Ilumatobacteraceae bacterium]|nr:GGDEF domain-containing protein [Ilumatobacteraceae bacterium]